MKNKLWKQWMLSGVLVSAMAVSYTHLDVYKRQVCLGFSVTFTHKKHLAGYYQWTVTWWLLFTHHNPARCFGMNVPKSRDIQAKIPLPQAIWNFGCVTENGVNSNDWWKKKMSITTKYTIFMLKIMCFFMFHVKHYVAWLK